MRPLKFRVWDKDNKCFLIRKSIEVNGFPVWVYCLPPTKSDPTPLGENTLEWCIDHQFENEGFVVMQFTGLLDKNGVEIYEGDILEHSKRTLFSVVWEQDGKWWLEASEENGYGSAYLWSFASLSKVIGNVFEHPHLLNPKE